MGIFIKRPLFLFCCSFIGASLLARCVGGMTGRLCAFATFTLLALLFTVISFKKVKIKYGLIETAIACALAALAFAVSFLATDLPQRKAERAVGENRAVEFVVLGEEYSSKYSSKYNGRLLYTDKGRVDQKAYLLLGHEADLEVGDRVFLVGNIELEKREESLFDFPSEMKLSVDSVTDKDVMIVEKGKIAFYDIGLLCAKLREGIKDVFLSRLEFDSAAMAVGITSGDDSLISASTVRDFRRAGLSHLLAVSGLHLAVIVGAIETFLVGARVRKRTRLGVNALLVTLVLVVSGFAESAVRSALMLFCGYGTYLLSRDGDAPTSLGVAGSLILLFSPLSVSSIGFWLSFLATFGLVTYLRIFNMRYEKLIARKKNGFARQTVSLCAKTVAAISVSLCANAFICIVFWIIFGEMSVIFPVANLFIASLAQAYLLLSLAVFTLGWIPHLGTLLSLCAKYLCLLITHLTAVFSSLDFSVVSLKYGFSGIIIVSCTVVLFILLVVKLKSKIFLIIPPTVGIAAFCICLCVHNALNTSVKGVYINDESRDALVISYEDECAVIDVSDGSYGSLYNAYEASRELYATEIESVVLTHYHENHIPSLDRFFKNAMVRRLCLPFPSEDREVDIMKDLVRSAVENDVEYIIYKREVPFVFGDEFAMTVFDEASVSHSSKGIISFILSAGGKMICYADSSWHESDGREKISHFAGASDALILGSHGPKAVGSEANEETACPDAIVFADIERLYYTFKDYRQIARSRIFVAESRDETDKIKVSCFEISS